MLYIWGRGRGVPKPNFFSMATEGKLEAITSHPHPPTDCVTENKEGLKMSLEP